MHNDLALLKNKADRLAEARRELNAIEEATKEQTANLKNEIEALKGDLLQEFSQLGLKSFKAEDGTSYTVTPTKSIAYDAIAEVQVIDWASQYHAVTLDKKKIKDLVKRGVALPDFIRIQETNTISIRSPKE